MTEWQILRDAVNVCCPELGRFAQRSPAFGAFALQQMTSASSVKEHFAAGAYLEPFRDRFSGLNSFGYDLLDGKVTRAQGLFSPRTLNIHFSLEYIAENLDAPAVVLQYPSKAELIRELKKGYDYVGISFLLAVMHRMKETVALIRQYAPNSKIVLGGYGTVLKDEALKPYGDYICPEEGVGFFRRLLGEP